ncbi:MAG: ECF transporter S component [Clostridiales bacterium]|nr:ECF transporter S component [Clostridiales bacterium]MDD7775085.1 ECF transporter S component [Eubacteriales bacterium]
MNAQTNSREKLKKIVATGVFAAFAYICCVLFHFRVSFLSFELKDAVMAVGAMSLGPIAGGAMVVIVCLVELVTISSTGVYGLVMNLLSSLTYVCVGSAIYHRHRTMRGAITGTVVASVAMVLVMIGANCVITPAYMHVETAEVIALIPTLLLPFNVTKTLFNSAVVFLLYKPVTNALVSAGFLPKRASASVEAVHTEPSADVKRRRRILVPVLSAVIVVACLLYFFLALNGSFTLR